MAPSPVRPLLVWSLPSIVVILSYLWYKKRRIGAPSDSGGSKPLEEKPGIASTELVQNISEELPINRQESSPISTPTKKYSRSLSGVETTPIDIVYPPELKSSKSSPIIISDEDLDQEIEKLKSMKSCYQSPSTISNSIKSPTAAQPESNNTLDQKHNTPNTQDKENSLNVLNNSSTSSVVKQPKKATVKNMQKKFKENNTNKQQKKSLQKDMAVVKEKINAMKISEKEPAINNSNIINDEKHNERNSENKQELQRQLSGRDSANHSPSDVMLASPSLSSISDNHSEGSNDSGKGCSEVATPPKSRTPNSTVSCNSNLPAVYEFSIPQGLVGKLIGKHGSSVQHIKDKSNAHIIIKKHPTNNKLKVCSVEGTQAEIEQALKIIRDKFPLKKFPELTLEQVVFTQIVPTIPLIPDHLYLKLVEGVNNDTILSCLVTPVHLFMQQPTHPTFPNLNVLTSYMNTCYSETECPLLPSPIPENTVCAAYSVNQWYRAMVLSSDEESNTSYIKFLDYGGYSYVDNNSLRQIRQDFILLPFQAAECVLSNVKSVNGDGSWPKEAYDLVADITKGSIIYTQIADYTDDGLPLVLCYVVTGPNDVVFLNKKLVEEGYAEWVPFEDTPQEQQPEGNAIAIQA